MPLTDAETARFARQLILPGFSAAAQEALRAATVVVGGPAEVTGPALQYLATCGLGTLLVDDALDVAPEDAAAWIYPPDRAGEPRAFAATEHLREASSFTRTGPLATGLRPTAALLAASSLGTAREASERARQARWPHVVAITDGEGGEVVSIPPGAPCHACASRPGAGGRPAPGAPAALGALAALELVLMLAMPGATGRRVELAGGELRARPTARVPGCACGAPQAGSTPRER